MGERRGVGREWDGARRAGLSRVPMPPVTARCPLVSAVLAARAPRKALGSTSINATDISLPAGDRRPVGLNRVCVRPVPAWQRGISDFLKLASKENRAPDGEMPGPSTASGLGALKMK
uniref:PCNA-associated factor n=1 Tax=Cyanoderma ruficeps TaxID=181631 RepID=A0A8C3RD66_9PASS